MASILNVDQINNAAGTSGIALDASTGKASFPNSVIIPNGATMPAGSVLQVVFNEYNTQTSITGTFANSGLSASITPTSNTNKVLIIIRPQFRIHSISSDVGIGFRILRGGTTIYASSVNYDNYQYSNGAYVDRRGGDCIMAFDAPATTSGVTYYLQGAAYAGTNVNMQNAGNFSQMTLMEIAQ